MYNSYQIPGSFNNPMSSPMMSSSSNDRLIGGGFAGPFLLGGITGGLLSPLFYGRPYYNNNYYYPPYPRPYPPRPYPPRPYPLYRPY